MRHVIALVLVLAGLTACAPLPQGAVPARVSQPGQAAERQFVAVIETVAPVAEAECRRVVQGRSCDFQIVVDTTPNQPPNAFQTLDRRGRPVLAFNLGLIASVENADELAFVVGHEAAHHILNHLARQQINSEAAAAIFSGVAAITGAGERGIQEAGRIGAVVGARSYSKDFEIEADRLGTLITMRAGYDPVRGAQFFSRLPDPGNQFLGTHPPNADRQKAVADTAAVLTARR